MYQIDTGTIKISGQKCQLSAESENTQAEDILKRFSRAIDDMATLREQNTELKRLLEECNNRG